MYVLLTNDDGIDSHGLISLKGALERVAEVAVFAPDRNWSASGHSRNLHGVDSLSPYQYDIHNQNQNDDAFYFLLYEMVFLPD